MRSATGDREIRIIGVPKAIRALRDPDLVGGPARKLVDRWRMSVERKARKKAPVWRGETRRAITSRVELDRYGLPRGRVGTMGKRVPQAEPMEFGTGRLSESPRSSKKRHWPPGSALQLWATQHGFEDTPTQTAGAKVAEIIGRRGGLRPRRFLRGAEEETRPRIAGWVRQMADEIEAKGR